MSRQLSMGLVINGVLKSFNLGCRSSMGGGGGQIDMIISRRNQTRLANETTTRFDSASALRSRMEAFNHKQYVCNASLRLTGCVT